VLDMAEEAGIIDTIQNKIAARRDLTRHLAEKIWASTESEIAISSLLKKFSEFDV